MSNLSINIVLLVFFCYFPNVYIFIPLLFIFNFLCIIKYNFQKKYEKGKKKEISCVVAKRSCSWDDTSEMSPLGEGCLTPSSCINQTPPKEKAMYLS